ncbi:MAG: sigma-70 family RNA polymerase sigma factor [Sediminicola sp.]|tara:strand:+ start:27218 stop:27712 length:495 start_codon:yes stop_codon:yes gene_type:complete
MTKEKLFETIYQEHASKVMRLVLGYVKGDKEQANDLVQDVFVKVWNNIHTFKGDSNIGTWVYRIAVNTCLMFIRSKKKLTIYTNAPTEIDQHSDEIEMQFRAMYECIDQLGEKDRSIILLELQDLPQNEIASIMGMTHEAIRTRVHRIKNILSKCANNEQLRRF